MQIGVIGLGKMGANIARRLMRGGHDVAVFDLNKDAIAELGQEGATTSTSLEDLSSKLSAPRTFWIMVPAGKPVDSTINALLPHAEKGDTFVEGGNSDYRESMRRGVELEEHGIDLGPSGSGHFVKMVHNGVEYGLMQAYAEGFALMKSKEEFGLDMHKIAKTWQHGSVVRSWLLDLAVNALSESPNLEELAAYVPDSGMGRFIN